MIELKNVTKSFQKKQVLKQVTGTFEKGKIHGIIGRNGSGKTVLLKCICGFLSPEEGEIFVDGNLIGIILETPGFLENMSGFRNLKMLASIKNQIGSEEIRKAMLKAGLNPEEKKAVRKYSLGMRQRLAIAQAIMESPKLLLLDEPMNGLDKNGVTEIRKLLLELKENGITILLASHYAEDIEFLCDTVREMDQGTLQELPR